MVGQLGVERWHLLMRSLKKVRIPRIFFRVNRRENWLKEEDGLTLRTEAKRFDDCWKEGRYRGECAVHSEVNYSTQINLSVII